MSAVITSRSMPSLGMKNSFVLANESREDRVAAWRGPLCTNAFLPLEFSCQLTVPILGRADKVEVRLVVAALRDGPLWGVLVLVLEEPAFALGWLTSWVSVIDVVASLPGGRTVPGVSRLFLLLDLSGVLLPVEVPGLATSWSPTSKRVCLFESLNLIALLRILIVHSRRRSISSNEVDAGSI